MESGGTRGPASPRVLAPDPAWVSPVGCGMRKHIRLNSRRAPSPRRKLRTSLERRRWPGRAVHANAPSPLAPEVGAAPCVIPGLRRTSPGRGRHWRGPLPQARCARGATVSPNEGPGLHGAARTGKGPRLSWLCRRWPVAGWGPGQPGRQGAQAKERKKAPGLRRVSEVSSQAARSTRTAEGASGLPWGRGGGIWGAATTLPGKSVSAGEVWH